MLLYYEMVYLIPGSYYYSPLNKIEHTIMKLKLLQPVLHGFTLTLQSSLDRSMSGNEARLGLTHFLYNDTTYSCY